MSLINVGVRSGFVRLNCPSAKGTQLAVLAYWWTLTRTWRATFCLQTSFVRETAPAIHWITAAPSVPQQSDYSFCHPQPVVISKVHPDFAPRAPAGPNGDSLFRPASMAVLVARTKGYPPAGGPGLAAQNTSLRPTIQASGVIKAAAAPSRVSQEGNRRSGPAGEFSTVPTLRNPSGTHQDGQLLQQTSGSSSYASSTDRLLRRFSILALDAPSSSELRSVFSRACNGAFAVDGPVFSAVGGSQGCPSDSAKSVLITSEVWKAIDAMGGVAAEFLHRLHQRLLKEPSLTSSSSTCRNGARSVSTGGSRPAEGGAFREDFGDGNGLSACRLDYFALGRLLRPLVLGRTGDISTPTAVQRLFCHEVYTFTDPDSSLQAFRAFFR